MAGLSDALAKAAGQGSGASNVRYEKQLKLMTCIFVILILLRHFMFFYITIYLFQTGIS
jgi:hypothetical protein